MSGGTLEALFNLHLLTHEESTITLILQFQKGNWPKDTTSTKAANPRQPVSRPDGEMFHHRTTLLLQISATDLAITSSRNALLPHLSPIDEIISFPFMTQIKSTVFLCSLFKHRHVHLFPTGGSPFPLPPLAKGVPFCFIVIL